MWAHSSIKALLCGQALVAFVSTMNTKICVVDLSVKSGGFGTGKQCVPSLLFATLNFLVEGVSEQNQDLANHKTK